MTSATKHLLRVALISGLLTGLLTPSLPGQAPTARLLNVAKIWDAAPHNAFTDLVRFRDQWFCVFREGQAHVSPDGALRILRSADGQAWESAAVLRSTTGDLRDAKITVTPNGQLMLSGAEALHDPSRATHQSLVWFSDDGVQWSPPHEIGDPNFWLWRTTWHGDTAYSIGYGCGPDNPFVRLYTSHDGRTFETRVPNLFAELEPNETSLVFTPEDVAYCLLRRDGREANGLLGTSRPPYTEWQWQDLGQRIGGPHMIQLPNGGLIAAVRLHSPQVRTGLCWLDPQRGTMQELLTLPSGGDTSYAGLVWHADRLWVSYYSSHEQRTSIYLAQVAIE